MAASAAVPGPDLAIDSVALPRGLARTLPAVGSAAPGPVVELAPVSAAPLRGFYLHGEAWASETLPLSGAVKVGWPRLHAVLSVAAGPLDRHGGSWAWGGGFGTVGRARGRFTPSLDVLQWVVSGDGWGDTSPGGSLTQLRPALAWQIKREGRWLLVGGPTLNLATTRFERPGNPGPGSPGPGPQPAGSRWNLGQGQWLWLNQIDEHSGVRLWPGVQVGLRF